MPSDGGTERKADHGFNLPTLLFLALVSITPFPARPFAGHLGDGANSRTAAAVYACLLAAPSAIWLARWSYSMRRGLLDPRPDPAYLCKLTLRYVLMAAAFAPGAALAAP